MLFKPTTALQKIIKLRKRIRAVAGGTSASKTISILCWLIDYAESSQNQIITIVAESVPHLKLGAMRDFKTIMQAHGYWDENKWNETGVYKFSQGSIIEFISFDKFGKAHGPRRDILFVNEANNIPYDIVDQLITRTRKIVWLDWNPSEEFWFYTEMLNKRDDVDFITLTYLDNEALDEVSKKEIESHKGNKAWWTVYGLGQLGVIENRIYKDWNLIDEIPHEARLERYGLDFGYTNDPTAIVAIYYYNGGYILDEITYQRGLLNQDIANLFKNLQSKLIIADSAEPKSIDELKTFGLSVLPAEKGKDSRRYGCNTVKDQRVSVTKKSVNLIKEYRNYLWKTDKDGNTIRPEEPNDGNDHCFAPNSLVHTTKGRIAIKDLVGKEGYLYSKDGQIKKFHNVRATRKNARMLNLEFNDGQVLSVTPDHLLLLPNGDWVEASLLRPSDMIQSVIYESSSNFGDKASFQWNNLLSAWKILCQFFYQKAITPNGLAIPLWRNSKGLSYSSQGQESLEQSNREFGIEAQINSFKRTSNSRKKSQIKIMGGENKTLNKEVAWLKKGNRVAQATWQENLVNKKTFRERLQSLPYEIYNFAIRKISKILPSELQNESQTKTIKRITRGFSALTYNLEVEDTHCLLVNGVIAHNCMDAIRYGIISLLPIIRRKEYINSLPKYPAQEKKQIAL